MLFDLFVSSLVSLMLAAWFVSANYWLNRKNCCLPEVGLITTFSPPMTTGGEELVLQTADEPRFVVDCKVKPAVIGRPRQNHVWAGRNHCQLRLDENAEHRAIAICAAIRAVPYRVLPDKINPAIRIGSVAVGIGPRPEAAVKLCRVVKPVPSVLTANTVPLPELPPEYAVPYRVLPDKINPASRISSVAAASETIQVRKTRAIGVDGEHRAIARTAATLRRPIQGVAR